ncbi:MAG: hypothetical protein IJU03_01090 [Thermoguttaceae bacterium]|nr:hypothetical protein [Thermoguttaceae bacterium]
MHYYKITITEKRTAEVFQQGESASEVGKQALNDAEKGSLDWALAVGKKEYWANVELADDMFADESVRVEREISLAE